ncbi:hypothetical protein PRIPAC_88024 [Pristionchus pacificus]|uniref:G protein-coupled receptor n=1 Tax=Pristionchus pacificus TaxID=54126 RepID=A0A2A6B9E4_PRIPA|nr:hypothetical protein PRIPAC_88024 [Pristionchus pacificus]|eukprot:PDM62512.1 G protein-coupled receptor [Pristionchus pacificus]
MNSTALDPNFQAFLVNYHCFTGVIVFILNSLVAIVILTDKDSRATSYRFYLLALQVASLTVDALVDIYTPVLLMNCSLIFSNSLLAGYLDIITFFTIGLVFVTETITLYFYCVFYRRTSQEIPQYLDWVHETRSFVIARSSIAASRSGLLLGRGRLYLNYSNDRRCSAGASERHVPCEYGNSTGAVPSIFYVLPVFGAVALYAKLLAVGLEASARDMTASKISCLLFLAIAMHTFAHSLTILACSPTHRRTIRYAFINFIWLLRRMITGTEIPKHKMSVSMQAAYRTRITSLANCIAFTVNALVSVVIIMDNDSRATTYRFYLLALQLSAMIMDILLDVYTPIVIINGHFIFSDSFLVEYIVKDILDDFYVLPWKHTIMLFLLRLLPPMHAAASVLLLFGSIIFMIWDVRKELGRGIMHASGATQRIQKRAISSLTLQGAIPSVCFVIPGFGIALVYASLNSVGNVLCRCATAHIHALADDISVFPIISENDSECQNFEFE